MTLKDLLVKIGFDIQGKEKLQGVEGQLEKIHEKLSILTGIEAARAVYELAERFAHFAEEIHAAAASAGITAEAFQKLAFAASQNAVSQEEMGGAMARLSRHLYDARMGGKEAAKVFAEAGFSVNQVDRFKTGSDVLLALADRFKTIQDPIKKQAIAMQLLGRGSYNMVAMLSKGSSAIRGMGNEAEKLGIILSGQQVEALVEVEHGMQKLWGVVKGFSATIAALFAPSITFIIDKMLKFYEINHKVIQEGVETWAHRFAYALGFIYGLIEDVVGAMVRFADSHRTLAAAIFTAVTSFGGLVTAVIVGIQVFSFFHDTVKKGMTLLRAAGTIIEFAKSIDLFTIAAKGAAIATSIWDAAMGVLTTEIAIVEAPLWAVIAVVGALVVGIHDLYVMLFNGESFENTWLGKFAAGAKAFFIWIGGALGSLVDGVLPGALDLIKNGIGGLFGGADPLQANLNSLQTIKTDPGSIAGTPGSNNSYSVDAPITVNVPAGADPKAVAQGARQGVRDHLDTVYRETSRSLRPTVAY